MLDLDPYPAADMPSDEPQATPRVNSLAGRGQSRIDSARLMQGSRELLIAHAGQEYRLRITRNDKLILTK